MSRSKGILAALKRSRIGTVVSLFFAALIVPLVVFAADVFVGTPPLNPGTGQQVSIELLVDVGPDILGSYFFTFQYDPAVVTIASVDGGTTAEFSSSPITDPATFTIGSTPLAAAQGSVVSPSGFLSVATITLNAVGLPGDGSGLDLTVSSLFDAELHALPAVVFASSVLVAMPEAATDLNFTDTDTMVWTASPDIPTYNAYRGSLPLGGSGFDHICFQANLPTPQVTDTDMPLVGGTGSYYLLSAKRNGVEGSLGVTSAPPQLRPNFLPCGSVSALSAPMRGSTTEPELVTGVRLERLGGDLVVSRRRDGLAARRRSGGPGGVPSRTVQLFSTGDVNGDDRTDAADVKVILESVVGTRSLSGPEATAADLDGDGAVSVADAQLLRHWVDAGAPRRRIESRSTGMAVVMGSSDCSAVDLVAGLNAIRLRCLPERYTAFALLSDLGSSAEVVGVQRFNVELGRFQTARFVDGQLTGEDFPVEPAESYLLMMKTSVHSFVPLFDPVRN